MLLKIKEQLDLKLFFRRPLVLINKMPWRCKVIFQEKFIQKCHFWVPVLNLGRSFFIWLRVSFSMVSWFLTCWLWLEWLCCIGKKFQYILSLKTIGDCFHWLYHFFCSQHELGKKVEARGRILCSTPFRRNRSGMLSWYWRTFLFTMANDVF